MPTFNIYKDIEDKFIFIEKNGTWFMGLLESEDEDFIQCPSFDDISMIVKENIRDYEFESSIADCNKCDNNGFVTDSDYDDCQICGCYHGQKHGIKSLNDHIESCEELRCGLWLDII